MIDLVHLLITAGDGGDGKVSLHREKYVTKGGPDGGHGGDGGSVVLVGSKHINTLKDFSGKKEIVAPRGTKGGRNKMFGPAAEDMVIEVPLGTVVWLTAENEASARRRRKYDAEHILSRGEVEFEEYSVQRPTENPDTRDKDALQPLKKKLRLAEITEDGQRVVLAQGGFGGRGNIAFKSSVRTTPLIAEYGTFGERREITLELKLLADVGLVGYPNAGKSTLLAKITRANPKTASYPFTTIEPNLGVLSFPGGRDVIVADIPGLIEGASEGKGLGLDFLRHVENCRALVFVLFLEEAVVSDEGLSDQQKADLVWTQYQALRAELKTYQAGMLEKPALLTLNKIDIYSEPLLSAIEKRFQKEGETLHAFSGFTGDRLSEILQNLDKLTAL